MIDEHAWRVAAPPLRPLVSWYAGFRQAGAAPRRHRGLPSPLLTFIITLDVQLVTAAQAHLVATMPGFERTHSRSVRFVHDSYQVVFKAFVATWRLGATA